MELCTVIMSAIALVLSAFNVMAWLGARRLVGEIDEAQNIQGRSVSINLERTNNKIDNNYLDLTRKITAIDIKLPYGDLPSKYTVEHLERETTRLNYQLVEQDRIVKELKEQMKEITKVTR